MIHPEIEQQEIVERYVRNRLAPEERRAFQEHFFTCNECFEQVQTAERFITGVRHAAETGLLSPELAERSEAGVVPSWLRRLRPVFAVTAAATLVLGGLVVWLLLYQLPQLREELAQERRAREQIEQERQQRLESVLKQLESERQAKAETETQLALAAIPEPNVPLVMLEAMRGAQVPTSELILPATARSLVLWMEVEPSPRFSSFQIQVYTTENQLVQDVKGLKKNAYGALAVGLPSSAFQAGRYVVKLYGLDRQQTALVGEYRLQITKR